VTPRRSLDWGFPRWRDYGADSAAATVRRCDRDGCTATGDRPAPKAPNRPERWFFCEAHAAEYNRNWNYFEGLSADETRAREADEAAAATFIRAGHWGWGGPGDGSRSRSEYDALAVLGCDGDAEFGTIKAAYRALAKVNHPDAAPGDAAAAARFQVIQAAYEVLDRAETRRNEKSTR